MIRTSRLKRISAAIAISILTSTAFAQNVLRIAVTDDPPHLDVHTTTAGLTSIVDLHILETLYTFNANFEPVPLLAEGENRQRRW